MLLSSCLTSVKIKDSEWCGDMGSEGASCFTTISGQSRDIPLREWEEDRFGMICGSPEAFLDWRTAIEKLCNKNKKCLYETKKKLSKLDSGLESFIELIDSKLTTD